MKFTVRFFVAAAALIVVMASVAWWLSTLTLPAWLRSILNSGVAVWTQPFFHVGGIPITLDFFVKVVLFILLLSLGAKAGRRFLRTRVLAHTSMDPGLQYALEVATGYGILILGIVVGLQSAGLNLSSLTFVTGALGVGIGFGLQNTVNNFVSGLILLIERPIKVGDRVEVGTLNGDIVRIGARSTWVRTNDNFVIIVPNSHFISNQVTNWTANDRRVRIAIRLGVSYSSDPASVRAILLALAGAHPAILSEPKPDVIFLGFGDSSLDFELRVWTSESLRTPHILKSDLYFSIFEAFQANHIEIPFPQRDVHLRSASPTIRVAGVS
jgi:small-conductance mechanosensitive channel